MAKTSKDPEHLNYSNDQIVRLAAHSIAENEKAYQLFLSALSHLHSANHAWATHFEQMGIKPKTTAMTRRGDNFIKELCELFGFKRNEVLSCDDERVINVIECAIAHKRGEAGK